MTLLTVICYSDLMNSANPSNSRIDKLKDVGLTKGSINAAAKVMLRAVLLGTFLYLILTDDPDLNLKLNILPYIIAVVWSYFDGVFAKRQWKISFLEAVFIYIGAVQFGRMLSFTFGNPLLGA